MSIKELGEVKLVEHALDNGNTIVYKVYNGTYYHAETPLAVINALETARFSGKRIRIWLGDKLGAAWLEEYDVEGYVNRSNGQIKVPILVNNSRSMGGGSILDHCIVRIKFTGASQDLYRHPKFKMPEMKITPSDLPDYFENVEATDKAGKFGIHARFKKPGQAQRWVNRMRG